MTDLVLVTNETTGSSEVVQLGYNLPEYDIAQTIGYRIKGVMVWGMIISIMMIVDQKDDGLVHTEVDYLLDNGDSIRESDVLEYYPIGNEPEEVEVLLDTSLSDM